LLLLASCQKPYATQVTPAATLPAELSDCTFHEAVIRENGPTLNIVRCPNSTTSATYQVGKGVHTTVTVDAPVTTPGPLPAASAALLEKVSKAADAADARKAARQRALEKLTEADMKALGLL
jgi:hypothetical protein